MTCGSLSKRLVERSRVCRNFDAENRCTRSSPFCVNKCRGDLNFQASYESVTYGICELIKRIERIKLMHYTHSAHTPYSTGTRNNYELAPHPGVWIHNGFDASLRHLDARKMSGRRRSEASSTRTHRRFRRPEIKQLHSEAYPPLSIEVVTATLDGLHN